MQKDASAQISGAHREFFKAGKSALLPYSLAGVVIYADAGVDDADDPLLVEFVQRPPCCAG